MTKLYRECVAASIAAALRAVLSLHPFPPFPPDVREPSGDVHVDLPGTRR